MAFYINRLLGRRFICNVKPYFLFKTQNMSSAAAVISTGVI